MAVSLSSYDLGQHSCHLCSGRAALQLVPERGTPMPHLEPLSPQRSYGPQSTPLPKQKWQQGSPAP